MTISAETDVDGIVSQEIGHFLMHGARRTDLVYPGRAGRWLLVVVADRDGADRVLQRLSRGWPESSEGLRAGLPALRWRIAGCFDTDSHLDDFVRTFLDQLDPDLPQETS